MMFELKPGAVRRIWIDELPFRMPTGEEEPVAKSLVSTTNVQSASVAAELRVATGMMRYGLLGLRWTRRADGWVSLGLPEIGEFSTAEEFPVPSSPPGWARKVLPHRNLVAAIEQVFGCAAESLAPGTYEFKCYASSETTAEFDVKLLTRVGLMLLTRADTMRNSIHKQDAAEDIIGDACAEDWVHELHRGKRAED